MTPLRPPVRPLAAPGAEHVVRWQPGEWMFRVFHAHPDPAFGPLRARVFGPVARFDPHVRDRHQRPKVQADGRGVQYLGDSLGCGLAEALPEQWPEVRICPNHRVVQAAPARPLALLDLRGDGAMAIGAVGTLGAGNEPRRLTQRWGRAIYEDLPALAGVVYRGAHQGGVSVAVWDRAGVLHARPGTPDDGEPLAGPRLRTRVIAALARQGRSPVWAADCPACSTR